jgi:hypothetical protein
MWNVCHFSAYVNRMARNCHRGAGEVASVVWPLKKCKTYLSSNKNHNSLSLLKNILFFFFVNAFHLTNWVFLIIRKLVQITFKTLIITKIEHFNWWFWKLIYRFRGMRWFERHFVLEYIELWFLEWLFLWFRYVW